MLNTKGINQNNTWNNIFNKNKEVISLYIFIFSILLISFILSPSFRSKQNIINILNQIPSLGFVAIGQTVVIITTGIDMSVGSVISLTNAIAASYMGYKTGSILVALCLIILSATIVGLMNGLIISRLGIEPLIVTLAIGTIIRGITLKILPYPGGYVPKSFIDLWLFKLGGVIPLSFIYFVIFIITSFFILKYTPFGRRVYAIGGNESKAKIAGININNVKLKVYLMSSLFSALTGLVLATRMRSGDPLCGDPFTLLSIAGVLVGGTTFSGGRGGVIGTVAGIFILSLIRVMLNIFGISPFYQNVLTGIIIVVAVIYSSSKR